MLIESIELCAQPAMSTASFSMTYAECRYRLPGYSVLLPFGFDNLCALEIQVLGESRRVSLPAKPTAKSTSKSTADARLIDSKKSRKSAICARNATLYVQKIQMLENGRAGPQDQKKELTIFNEGYPMAQFPHAETKLTIFEEICKNGRHHRNLCEKLPHIDLF